MHCSYCEGDFLLPQVVKVVDGSELIDLIYAQVLLADSIWQITAIQRCSTQQRKKNAILQKYAKCVVLSEL